MRRRFRLEPLPRAVLLVLGLAGTWAWSPGLLVAQEAQEDAKPAEAASPGEPAGPAEPAEPAEPAAPPAPAVPAEEPAAPTEPAVVPEPLPRPATQYYRELKDRPVASVGDALRVFYLLTQGKDDAALASAARAQTLAAAHVLPAAWAGDPRAGLTKGVLGHMVCRSLGIRGGVLNFLTRQSRRYAFRECKHRGLMSGESHKEYVSGGELLAVLRRCNEHKTGRHMLEEGK